MRKQSLLTLMKAITFSLIFISTAIQAQSYEWTVGNGGPSTDEGHALTTDAAGNVFIAGSFNATIDFDPSANDLSMTSNGGADVFIQKLDANGQLLWAKTFGGTSSDYPEDMVTDANGNVYIIGYYRGTVDFDPSDAVDALTAHGVSDIFIEKLDADGNYLWAKSFGGTSLDEGYALAIDAQGYIYTTGLFRSTVDFDPGDGVTELTANGNKDIFIQKLDNDGNFVWAKNIGGSSNDKAFELVVDATGNVYITGTYEGTVDFDPTANTVSRTSRGYSDIFVEKFDTDGNYIWLNTIEGAETLLSTALAIASDGSVYTTGSFAGEVDFDPNPTAESLISSVGGTDGFIQKINTNGEFVWAKAIGGVSTDAVNFIDLDAHDNILITGSFSSAFNIDPSMAFQSSGLTDAFLVKYDPAGGFVEAVTYGGVSTDAANKTHITPDGSIYTVGTFLSSSIDFDPTSNEYPITNMGGSDAFIQKMKFCITADMPAVSATSTQVCPGENLNLDIISGNLNSATQWVWHEGSCDGNVVAEGMNLQTTPTHSTTYYVAAEGGCITSPICQTIEVVLNQIQTVNLENTTCYGDNFTFADGTVVNNITEAITHTSTLSSLMTGCDSMVTTTVNPISVLAPITEQGKTLISSAPDAMFQWINANTGLPIENATNASFTPTETGNYAVVVTQNGCSATSAPIFIRYIGQNQQAHDILYDFYPNPMFQTLNIDLNIKYIEGDIKLFHITGKQVFAKTIKDQRHVAIDVNDLEQGIYFLEVTLDGIPTTTKLVK